jgi:L-glyceraldehyde 3-phosphate reductase
MIYNRCGRSGLKLPAISLGLWHNFGFDKSADSMRAICRQAFDLGVTHFDLANNYGPPPGSAELAFGDILRGRLAFDGLVFSTKAGYNCGQGLTANGAAAILASLDQSQAHGPRLCRHLLFAPLRSRDPAQETMGALDHAVRQGKALPSAFPPTMPAARRKRPLFSSTRDALPHPSAKLFMINRWIEDDHLLDTLEAEGVAPSFFRSRKASDRQISRRRRGQSRHISHFFNRALLTPQNLERARQLDAIAKRRGQTLAQMALRR